MTVVRSAAGEAREIMRFPFDELALESRLKDLQIALLRSGGRYRQVLVPGELTWLPGQTWQDLQRAMHYGPWHIFHFIGHGGFDARTDEGLVALVNLVEISV